MNDLLRTFFTYSKNQQRGITVLAISLLAMLIYLSVDQYFYDVEKEIDRSHEVQEFLASIEADKQIKEKSEEFFKKDYLKKKSAPKVRLNLKSFNPNRVSVIELKEMGISEHIAKNLVNYREKVGPFKAKEDVQNLYTVNAYLYSKLESYLELDFSESIKDEAKKEINPKQSVILNIDINLADTIELKKIKGIGPFFARQIVKYRNAIGGFHSESQFSEVYKLCENEQSLKGLKENTFIEEASWNRININDIDKDQLLNHPYFWGNFGKVFINYCELNRPFKNVEDIKKCHLVSDEIYLKIAPYLKLN